MLVKEAATRVGIRDVDYFTRRFKERFGVLPSEYPFRDGGPNDASGQGE